MVMSEAHARERNCYLTTRGRVSGNPHEVEIWFAADDADAGTLYILSGGRDRADWVRNIRHNGQASIRVGDAVYHGQGRLLAPADPLDRRAREVVATKYQEWTPERELSDWARTSLPVAITLDQTGGAS